MTINRKPGWYLITDSDGDIQVLWWSHEPGNYWSCRKRGPRSVVEVTTVHGAMKIESQDQPTGPSPPWG